MSDKQCDRHKIYFCAECESEEAVYLRSQLAAEKARAERYEKAAKCLFVYANEHTTRCAFVNRPDGFCTCKLPERIKEIHEALAGKDEAK